MVDPAATSHQRFASEHERHRHELQREFAVMVLYVSIVLLATLAALPTDFGHDGSGSTALIAVIWGTAIGLALAHWFAFVVAAAGFRGGQLFHRHDLELATAQVAGAAIVALSTTIPVVVSDRIPDVRAAVFAPALFIGLASYRVAKTAGRSTAAAVVAGIAGLVLGLIVAIAKAYLGGH